MNSLPEENPSPEMPKPEPSKPESPTNIPEPDIKPFADALEPPPIPKPKKASIIPDITGIAILAVFLLIILFDYFIYQGSERSGGAGLGVLILLSAIVIWFVENKPLTKSSVICGILVLIFALRTIWQAVSLAEIISFMLLFTFACSSRQFLIHIPELCHYFLLTFVAIPLTLLGFGKTFMRFGAKSPGWSLKGFRIGLTWLIPAAVVLVFLFIFAMGNIVVESWMGDAWDWVWKQISNIFEYISFGRLFFWIVSFFIAIILLIPKNIKRTILTPFLGEDEKMEARSPLPAVDLRETIAINTLIAVNVLFFVYNAVDISFLWIKRALPEGFAYSVYARSGTLWLTMALALTSLILGIIFIRDLNFHRRASFLKILSWIWVAQNLVLALATFRRLQVYIDYNGLTRLRIVGAYGITLVVIGLLIVAFKMQRVRSFLWMIRRHLLAFALALFALAVTPMDWLVFKYNTGIILYENPRSAIQLIVQPITAEGIPPLIPLLDSKDQAIREGVAGILLREQARLQKLKDAETRWADKELSRSNALEAIKSARPKLDEIIPDGNWQKALKQLDDYARRWW
ncbi:MAG: DUF4173 domain-containing protein [Planctomycetes bacterium]|nr:DUF4173 domain-containing protein [Planctomycetota bacterium]